MNDPSHRMNRSFGIWNPAPPEDPARARPVFSAPANPGRMKWKRKNAPAASAGAAGAASGAYKPPTLKELQSQNRARARRFYPKKKFARFAPSAPFNTTSFIIRAKKAGGLASLVSPCPVTPAILPTPKFSPSRERLVDMAKEEWGVDGYGSMKGLIRLRPGAGDAEEVDDGSSESDVEEHAEVERRLDQDLSRFEMVYPSEEAAPDTGAVAYRLEHRIDEQDTHIARLEEENLTLKERLFLMEREMEELRRRLLVVETRQEARDANIKDEYGNAIADDVSDARGDGRSGSGGDCEGSDQTPPPITQGDVNVDVNDETAMVCQ